jgi:hypothetical protein
MVIETGASGWEERLNSKGNAFPPSANVNSVDEAPNASGDTTTPALSLLSKFAGSVVREE